VSRRVRNPYAKPDVYARKAKEEGFAARSVYKLEEIDRRAQLLRAGMKVLDLGAAPGSWSTYAARKIGAAGRLLAVDLKPLVVALPPNATFIQGDALSLENEKLALYAPYDVVLSDMAPQTTGTRMSDQAKSFELFMRALAVGATLLVPGGSFVGKIFMGEDLPVARAELRKHFHAERIIRPASTRAVSYEIFLLGLKKKGAA
jgi:23S rRNA (uridine2552-2'-O)-methyltransferase